MAFRILRVFGTLTKYTANSVPGTPQYLTKSSPLLLASNLPTQYSLRPNTFFCKIPAEQLWKSVVSVSNAGRKRGRGRAGARRLAKNLNKGQTIGDGKISMDWPGLNAPILQGSMLKERMRLPDDPDREEKMLLARQSTMRVLKKNKLSPLERGWTSASMGGRFIGPPDPVKDQKFEGFDTVIIEGKIVCCMSNNMGKKRRFSLFVVTGNKNGLAGFSQRSNPDVRSALKHAKNRAGQKLIFIERCENRTIFHDFFAQFGRTKLFVEKKPEGYGLRCHRAIKECCKLIGITDIKAKIEGSTNVQSIVKCFFLGLLRQKTYEQLSEEKKLHIVEFKKENDYFPTVVASPKEIRKHEDIDPDEIMDFKQYVLGGGIVLQKKKYPPFYTKLPSWTIKLRQLEYLRDQEKVRLRMYMEHGELRSFYTDEYPDEARPNFWSKKLRESQQLEE